MCVSECVKEGQRKGGELADFEFVRVCVYEKENPRLNTENEQKKTVCKQPLLVFQPEKR